MACFWAKTLVVFLATTSFAIASNAHPPQDTDDFKLTIASRLNAEAFVLSAFEYSKDETTPLDQAAELYIHAILFTDANAAENKDTLIGIQGLAERNVPAAQYALGALILEGKRLERNIDRGLQLLEQAMEQGYLQAKYYLGCLSLGSTITKPNIPLGIELLRSAARQKNPSAIKKINEILTSNPEFFE